MYVCVYVCIYVHIYKICTRIYVCGYSCTCTCGFCQCPKANSLKLGPRAGRLLGCRFLRFARPPGFRAGRTPLSAFKALVRAHGRVTVSLSEPLKRYLLESRCFVAAQPQLKDSFQHAATGCKPLLPGPSLLTADPTRKTRLAGAQYPLLDTIR